MDHKITSYFSSLSIKKILIQRFLQVTQKDRITFYNHFYNNFVIICYFLYFLYFMLYFIYMLYFIFLYFYFFFVFL